MEFTSAELGILAVSLVLFTVATVFWTAIHGGTGTWIAVITIFASILSFFFVGDSLAKQLDNEAITSIFMLSVTFFGIEYITDFRDGSPLIKRKEYNRFVHKVMRREAEILARKMIASIESGKNTAEFKFNRSLIPDGFIRSFRSMLDEELLPHKLCFNFVEQYNDEVTGQVARILPRNRR